MAAAKFLYAPRFMMPDYEKSDETTKLPSIDPSNDDDSDVEFGGYEQRKIMERRLVRKLDVRMSILVIIYILNYVCKTLTSRLCSNISHSPVADRPK